MQTHREDPLGPEDGLLDVLGEADDEEDDVALPRDLQGAVGEDRTLGRERGGVSGETNVRGGHDGEAGEAGGEAAGPRADLRDEADGLGRGAVEDGALVASGEQVAWSVTGYAVTVAAGRSPPNVEVFRGCLLSCAK